MIERLFVVDLQDKSTGAVNAVINQGNVDTVTFSFKIYDGVNEIDYSRFDTARITLSRGNKTILNSPCQLETDSVTYKVEPEALGYIGTIKGQLDLSRTGTNLATTYFSFEVIGSLTGLSEADKRVFVNDIKELIAEIEIAAEKSREASAIVDAATGYLTELDGIMGNIKVKAGEINSMAEDITQSGQAAKDIALEAEETVKALRLLLNESTADAKSLTEALDTASEKLKSLDLAIAQAQDGVSGIESYLETAGNDAKAIQDIKSDAQGIKDDFAQTVESAKSEVAAQTAAVASAKTTNVGIMERHVADVARKKEDSVQEINGYVEKFYDETLVTQNELLDTLMDYVRNAKDEAAVLLEYFTDAAGNVEQLLSDSEASAETMGAMVNEFNEKNQELAALLASSTLSESEITALKNVADTAGGRIAALLSTSEISAERIRELLESLEGGLAVGPPGQDGKSPYIGENGRWYEWRGGQYVDTGIAAKGQDGHTPVKNIDYFDGEPGPEGKQGEPGSRGNVFMLDGKQHEYSFSVDESGTLIFSYQEVQ